jgi:aminopeptidase-like protein
VRKTLSILSEHIDIAVREVRTGTQVFDWIVPQEWTVRGAVLRTASGRTIVDFASSNLHLVNYSEPVSRRLSLEELRPHLHTLPDQPDLIPYRTSYYARDWGFCMAHRDYLALPDEEYEVIIDTELADGTLTYGEVFLPGETDREVLFSAHICHPSLANDNCSGLAVLTRLAQTLAQRRNRFGYRFLFAPGTIGSLCWLAANEGAAHRIDHGLVVSCIGDGRRSGLQAQPPWQCRYRPGDRCRALRRAAGWQRWISVPSAMTNASSARRASIFRWVCCNEAPSVPSRNIIPRPTTWTWCNRNTWHPPSG